MEPPHIYRNGRRYDLSCNIPKDVDLEEKLTKFNREELQKNGRLTFEKYHLPTDYFPIFSWGENGRLLGMHISEGGRWIDSSKYAYHFHNIDYSDDALAGTEILIGEYLNKLGLDFPFIKKEKENFYFEFKLTKDRDRVVRKARQVNQEAFKSFTKDVFESFQFKGESPSIEWSKSGELYVIKLKEDSGLIELKEDSYQGRKISNSIQAMAAFKTLIKYLDYVLQD
ncbi:MAG: hypothetical protein KJ583_03285 [Nanoarchaeota archaeon]|nr:hypothetical protein [Nanoarchaeota archaeon]MBU1269401.1 hypothetical protein [Nanoarchaeota archaeon]MBU1604318.1 hypothetical protein [Nanoarchaeota archaeon]